MITIRIRGSGSEVQVAFGNRAELNHKPKMVRFIRLPMHATRELRVAVSQEAGTLLHIPRVSCLDLSSKLLDLRQSGFDERNSSKPVVIVVLGKRQRPPRLFEFAADDIQSETRWGTNPNLEGEIFTIDLRARETNANGLTLRGNNLEFLRESSVGIKSGESADIIQLYGDASQFDFSPWYLKQTFGGVRTCHELEYVRNNTEITLRLKLSSACGPIIWRDYGSWVGITHAANRLDS